MPKCEFAEVGTHLKVADLQRSLEFYESIGFEPTFAFGDQTWLARFPGLELGKTKLPYQYYRGVELRVPGHHEWTRIELGEGHPSVRKEVFKERIPSPKVSWMLKVKSLLPLLQNRLVTGALKFPIRRYAWSAIEVAVRDPDGFVLVFIFQSFDPKVLDREQAAIEKLGYKVETIGDGKQFRD